MDQGVAMFWLFCVGGILLVFIVMLTIESQLQPLPRARRAYFRVKRASVTPFTGYYFDPFLNLIPTVRTYENFTKFVNDVEDVLKTRNADTTRTLEVVTHLLKAWPDVINYNAWSAVHQAQGKGLLNKHFMPR